MATSVRIKFRPSKIDGEKGCLYYQIIHNREQKQLTTEFKIYPSEWDDGNECIVTSECQFERRAMLVETNDEIGWTKKRLKKVAAQFAMKRNRQYTIEDLLAGYEKETKKCSLKKFMLDTIDTLHMLGKDGTTAAYVSTYNSFMRFRKDKDMPIDGISNDMMMRYEAYLRNNGITKNATSFYMRIMRAIYNRAVEKKLVRQSNPFKHVYTGIDKTRKRAISINVIKQLKEIELSHRPALAHARDMFLFSFYTRGMAFVDMAYLKRENVKNGYLVYNRKKTGQPLYIKWEKCMKEIVERYADTDNKYSYKKKSSRYLLPIVRKAGNIRLQYKSEGRRINYNLKRLSAMLGLPQPLTMYVARHSWASIAKSKKIPLSVISQGMGHDNERTTRIYLASLDSATIDDANKKILNDL